MLLQVYLVFLSQKGAKVTSLEPSTVLHEMLKDNAHYDASIETINQSFESISASDLNNVDLSLHLCVQQ